TTPWRSGQKKPFASIPRINWSHPLARGLVTYMYDAGGGVVIDLVTGRTATARGPSAGAPTSQASVQTSPYGSSLAVNNPLNNQQFYIQVPGTPTLDSVPTRAPYSSVAGYMRRGANSGWNGGYGAVYCLVDPGTDNQVATWIAIDPSSNVLIGYASSSFIPVG